MERSLHLDRRRLKRFLLQSTQKLLQCDTAL